MALIKTGGIGPTFSGKVGNTVFARNKGGAYARNWVKPINPATPQQTFIRNILATLSARWKELTPTEIAAWTTLANNTPVPNRLGDTITLPPLAMFQKVNVGRYVAGLPEAPCPAAPLFVNWDSSHTVLSINGGGPNFQLAFDDAASWCGSADSGVLVYLSEPQSQKINFFKGKYNFYGVVLGNATPITSPFDFPADARITTGQRWFWRAYLTTVDGHLGDEVTGFVDN